MYTPAHFHQPDIGQLHALMHSHPLATLITLSSDGLSANHIPFILSEEPAPYGTLRGHIAKGNALWKDYRSEVEALAVFYGADTYITPSWYATKQETGMVVPTWNYTVVHAYGTLRIIHDPEWLRGLLNDLTDSNEASFSDPWSVSDAPEEFTEGLLRGIVGIELPITRLIGKWKVNQNQPAANRQSVIEGLRAEGGVGHRTMAELVERAIVQPPDDES